VTACVPCNQGTETTASAGSASVHDCICLARYFRPSTGACVPCPIGTTCDGTNSSLFAVLVDRDYWRPGKTSSDTKPCPYGDTCAGGTNAPNAYDPASTDLCVPGRGLSGAYCMLCEKPYHFFYVARHRCEPCDGEPQAFLIFLLVGIVGVVVLAIVARRCLRVYWYTIWRQSVVSRWEQAWPHAKGSRPAIKIVFSFFRARQPRRTRVAGPAPSSVVALRSPHPRSPRSPAARRDRRRPRGSL
jgi:hypothetical protein